MQQRKIKVSVIIVNYKSIKDTINCILSLGLRNNIEIIIVDNGNSKVLENKLNKISKNIIYINSGKNLGYGAGNNLGAKYAQGEYLLILNPDTRMSSSAIDDLVGFLDKTKKAAIAAPLLIDKKGNYIKQISAKKLTPQKYIFTYTFMEKLFSQNKAKKDFLREIVSFGKPYEVEVVAGSALMIRRNIFEKLGGFDNKFFMYFEDNDLCDRVRNLGNKIYKIPSVKVVHDWKPAEGNKKLKNIFEDSRSYYFKKHYGLFSALTVEVFSRFTKNTAFLLALIFTGLFLRLYKLEYAFPFSGEVGHNLLEIKNYYENGQIPLVGPPTSHSWLKFGPLFYWIYGPVLIFSKFNPLSYAYFGTLISVLTIPLNYLVVKKIFNKRIAVISTVMVTFSPLYITYALHARFFNIVSILIYPFLLVLYKYLFEDRKKLFWLFFTLGIILNFHYSPLFLIPSILILSLLKNIKIDFGYLKSAILGLSIPLLTLFIYDIKNKFSMVFKFILWIPYRIAGFFGIIPKNNLSENKMIDSFYSLYDFIIDSFITNVGWIGIIIFFVTILYIVYLIINFKNFNNKNAILLILTLLFTGIISLVVHGGLYIQHYFLPLFPIPLILFSILLSQFIRTKYKYLVIVLLCFLVIINTSRLIADRERISIQEKISEDRFFTPYKLQKQISEFIVNDAQKRPFSFERIGHFDYYEGNYAQNYQYLLWFLGNEPVEVGTYIVKKNIEPEIKYTLYEEKDIVEKDDIYYQKGNIVVIKTYLK